jgi:predicted aspartyl protease
MVNVRAPGQVVSMKLRRIACVVVAGLVGFAAPGAMQAARAQTAGPPVTGGTITCAIDHRGPSDADKALTARQYADAERLYGAALAADAASGVAMAGLVRTTLAEDKLPEALALAMKFNAAHPNDPEVLNALGEVRFRRGEVDEAATAFNRSMQLNPCNGVTHYDAYRFFELSGMYASAQRRLELAHRFSPDNPEIGRRWRASHALPLTSEQQLALLKARLDSPPLTQEQKDGIQAAIQGIEAREKGSCELVSPVTETKVPIVSIADGPISTPQEMYGAGLDVEFNGKKRRLEIDTGASGMLLSRSVAKSAGLVPELEVKTGGVGDQGPANSFVTHVDDIKIGNMEFRNCMVRVLEQGDVLGVDGLIGTDVFRDYVVTLDIPDREMRIGPLPRRPDEAAEKPTSLNTSDADETPVSVADSAKDRYIAPEMKDWTPVFRSGHNLIFPTVIGNAPLKLFLMDTGASHGMISPEAAREVTHVSGGTDERRVKGISGEVNKVLIADRVSITFAGVRQITEGMTSFDSAALDRSVGVEISGMIGFPTLRELVLSIDYRDNLVHVVYDPKKGFHAH